MAIKILQIDLQNDITPQIGSYDNAGGVTPNNWLNEDGVYSLGPTNVDGTTPYYWFTPTREVTDFDLCWEDYQDRSQTTAQYHLEIGDSAGNVVLSALRSNNNYYIGPVNVGEPAYQTWHKILVEVRKASASSSTVTAYVDGKKVATGTSDTLLTSAKIALLGHVPNVYHWQNAGQRVRYVTIYDRSYTSKGINLDGMMTTITGLISKLRAKLSAVAFTGSYNDLSDKPTISTVNDGTLTIQKNGSNVATFTANQSTAATANITVPTAVSELTNDSGYLTSSSNLDASKLTSGTVDIARLPQGALERLVKVANEAARYALTIADVQLGDTVQQLDTGIMYVVTDTDHLDSAAGYTEYTAGTAASVPWSGVTGKPTFAAVATSGAYSDLTGTPTIPTVNNATLTIQQNGTTVDTFTANSSTDKTVNIAIPTKTSDLTNDSGFITEDNTKIPLAGSNQISGSLIPATTDAYDLGGSSYQWNNAYIKSLTINGVACGDILTHNASEFVDVTSGQTIAGVKLFKDTIIRNVGNFTAGEAPTAQVTCVVLKHTNNDGTQNANSILSYMFTNGESMCELVQNPCIGSTARTWFRTNTDGSYSIYPYTKNGSLGVPGYKWKDVQTDKINGLVVGDILTHNASEFVPRSGGAVITGTRLSKTTNDSELSLDGGTGYPYSATISLYGQSNAYGQGCCTILVHDVNQGQEMWIKGDGTWTWTGTACVVSSDRRIKDEIESIPDEVLDAWENLEPKQYKYKSDLENDKDDAQVHYGWIAQEVESVIKGNRKDDIKSGLCLHQFWDEQEEVSHEETYTEEVQTKDGTTETVIKTRKVIDTPYREKGDSYGLRYTECLVVECAYLRKCIKELRAEIEELKKENKENKEATK